MLESTGAALTILTALGCGLMAGVFFAFSVFVMKALSRLTPASGIAAMQEINAVVINPVFLGAFLGTALACAVLITISLVSSHRPGAVLAISGSLVYLAGTFGVTVLFNIPRNNALAKVDPTSETGGRFWADFLRVWTAWNHVRTIAALSAAALLTIAASMH